MTPTPAEIAKKIAALKPGEVFSFDHFSVKRVSAHDYFLRDDRVRDRARWGTLKQILEDVGHCLAMDCLPLPSARSQ